MQSFQGVKKKRILYCGEFLFISILFLLLTSCANRISKPCVKDGRVYCVSDEWIFSENWYSCYLRGISCTQGGCWENARDEFLRAVQKRGEDMRWVRTYGMHRLPEYFPNRELGIAYFHLSDLDSALMYLSVSLDYCESAKAKYYINKVRRQKLIETQEDKEPPQLFLDEYPQTIAQTKLLLSGNVQDDTFVADIMIQVNQEEFISLLELSQPQFKRFQHKIFLRPGINDVFIKAIDLLGKQQGKHIKILVDKEGPMIYFAEPDAEATPFSLMSLQGMVYDPSGVAQFYLNGKKVKLKRIDEDSKSQAIEPCPASYSFHYDLSAQEWEEGILHYQAEDYLKNWTTGTITFSTGHEREKAFHNELIRIAAAPQTLTAEYVIHPGSYKTVHRRNLDPVQIRFSELPKETFEEEICPQIEILARCRIREITINGEPILSIYGLEWTKFFELMIKKYLGGKKEGRILFNRMIKLKQGENIIHFKVVDISGKVWEKWIRIIKKTKKVHQLKHRWRMAIPFIMHNPSGDDQDEKKKMLTYQLIEAFVNQGRFRVIELENLPIIINEKRLSYYIGNPLLGLSSNTSIWIDIFLLGYVQETDNSLTLSASLVDLDTGEILATKDVYEEIDSSELVWQKEFKEHTFHICSILAAKFKEHFPLCEGSVISINGEELKTGICKNDGLKKGMKLLLYTGDLDQEGDFAILGNAKVQEVNKEYSLARVLNELKAESSNTNFMNLGVITR